MSVFTLILFLFPSNLNIVKVSKQQPGLQFNENTRQVMDNARNYAKIFFSKLLNCIYLSISLLPVMFICKKSTFLYFYANT